MKTIEEKAKAYDEALERAQKATRAGSDVAMDIVQYIFPDLKESEDERIRKMCITAVNIAASSDGGLLHSEASECLAWLEEQKDKNCLACDQHLKGYIAGRKVTEEEKQKEQKPVEWTELTWKDIVELEGIINNVHYDFSAGIGQESFGKEVLERFRNKKDDAEVDACEQKPAETQNYSGLNDLERAIHRGFLCAGVENVPVTIIKETAQDCLAHLPAEWSEEDEKKIHFLSRLIDFQVNDGEYCFGGNHRMVSKQEAIEMLLSLRPVPSLIGNPARSKSTHYCTRCLLCLPQKKRASRFRNFMTDSKN